MIALFGFVFLGLFSPGPNVILLTASGARFGFKPTLPHLLGVAVGVGVIAFVTGLGVGALIDAIPMVRFALMVIASIWILLMAWKLWHAEPANSNANDRPFSFREAILFQWVNPKIWAVALAAVPMVFETVPLVQAITLGATFSFINLAVCLFWTYAGSILKALLEDPRRWRLFNRGMALALALFSGLVFL